MTGKLQILHVTECYSAGVGAVINAYARNLGEVDHHVLYVGTMDPTEELFVSSAILPDGMLARAQAVKAAVRRLRPDALHAHSSWAGVYARLLPVGVPVIYEPHCLSFERPDLPRYLRAAFRWAEQALSGRTSAFVALTRREADLLEGLAKRRAETHLVTNTSSVDPDGPHRWSFGRSKTVLMSGRIAAQKDPRFFADTARRVARLDPTVTFRWLGDGEPELASLLIDAGVEVTGWLSKDEVAAELARCGSYLHSGSYEGLPLSVLDACHLGAPIVVRDIPAFAGSGLRTVVTPADAAAAVVELCSAENAQRAVDAAQTLRLLSTDANQKIELAALYERTTGRPVGDRPVPAWRSA
ncbi:MAG: glycosyltransferase [Nakamurella sp.]